MSKTKSRNSVPPQMRGPAMAGKATSSVLGRGLSLKTFGAPTVAPPVAASRNWPSSAAMERETAVLPAVRPKPIRVSLRDAQEKIGLRHVAGAAKISAARVSGPVHSYIYDTFVQEMKYLKTVREIENRLVDLGINGRTHRLSCFKNLREIVSDDVARGIKTVVIIGNDESLIRVMDAAGESGVVLGFIPMGPDKENQLAKILGIGAGTVACDILSARLLQKIDLGVVNGHYFLTNIDIPAANLFVECDDKYKLSFLRSADIRVCNLLGWQDDNGKNLVSNPSDGFLETVVYSKSSGFLGNVRELFKEEKKSARLSVFYNRKINIIGNAPFVAWVDRRKVLNKKLEITIAPGKLKMIIGKNRQI